ncbi:MAG TPA: FAD-dependent oxidoreductase [Vicinamibacterales bacterium]|nr:FAD-dependent oxidoreductase [Vicinamibacterales bacterium]
MAPAFVIVGASLAGASAAITLRKAGVAGSVTLIGAEPEAPYERPPLSKAYLRGQASFDSALVRVPAFYAEHGIATVLGTAASRIDTDRRFVELVDGRRFPFDSLLLATGTRVRQLTTSGASLQGIHSLRTVADANRIRAEMSPGRRAVVVGMGFIGSEVAASLRQDGLDVTAIEPSQTPLYRVFGETVGRRIAELHRVHGVRTVFEDTVESFDGDQRVAAVVTKNGRRFGCDFVVAGIGVEPAVGFLDGSGIHTDNGIVVDEYCRTNLEGIYAAGDVANHYHPVFKRRIRVEHWQNAMRQGAAAARNMLGEPVIYDDIPWFWSDQYDWNLQYAGFHRSWDQLVVRGQPDGNSFLACYLNDSRIDAAIAVNRGLDLRRVIRLIKARQPVDPRVIADESTDLRQIAA